MPAAPQPTLVFLHGFAESPAIWADFTRDFPSRYRLLMPALPGHGPNPAPVTDYAMEAQAQAVLAQLDAAGADKVVLVGHSMGGYVALALAEAHPARVAGLVLFHSTALPDNKEKKAARDESAGFVRRHGVEKYMRSAIRPLLAPGNRKQLAAELKQLEDLAATTPVTTILGCLEAMKHRPDRTQVLRDARFPVLFIGGHDDPAVPLDTLLPQLALPAQSHALLLRNVGHLGFMEAPELTRQSVLDFCAAIC
ncbi:alpha/beta fold hydrolase [Hymenobacter psychrophilus]|uniref:Pimeloyl-ACP methyl ester carboxylesterase n=1 Tax=Hymenobacter psychrophilus TaxID=651662 RepID=A0A1H3ERF7_9BACT|nr:alpha/beta hydrolase [Hymenobacter psychrophilus]SDX81332.1 Pimeloyl-ACP methyl ester carboxylesterase [Hymenobacter psychrophilus]